MLEPLKLRAVAGFGYTLVTLVNVAVPILTVGMQWVDKERRDAAYVIDHVFRPKYTVEGLHQFGQLSIVLESLQCAR